LRIDSPGGFVADSHQIYHELYKLHAKKPVYVQMQRMAASGGYYIAMGAGPKAKIFAEPTTWTGSIGVIIPRYDVSELAKKYGVDSAPLKTGEFKDSLNPFRPLSDAEKGVWSNIMDQSFQTFLQVIDDNREKLSMAQVQALATGQIYTAKDALANGLVDAIGYEEETLKELQQACNLSTARVVTYSHPTTLVDVLLGAKAQAPRDPFATFLDNSVPRAMYHCSWLAPLPQ
jgi:protease IV